MRKMNSVVLATVLLLIGVSLFSRREQAAAREPQQCIIKWRNVSLAAHQYGMRFFDHSSGKIYEYSESGELYGVWILEELGKNLVKVDLQKADPLTIR